ncbi:uncharacterized protein TNCV_3941961 [Trichonephila clavipes]|uniref:Chromo domain-containing protein n=1 Tax=Trichonephila clavipes TaxID=2585209 RepID=A0A8X6VW12_TRICX|nr:uncharacterized protein TNCV_3941961 [Trichonephila clavipes]
MALYNRIFCLNASLLLGEIKRFRVHLIPAAFWWAERMCLAKFNLVSSINPRTPSEAEEENCDLIVLDDMMNDVTSEISQMFTMGSHHKKYSIILITQNLFPRVKSMRDISLNAHYIILFRNNRDVSQAACFGRQAFPGHGKFFMDSYKKGTEEPFSYLLVDVHPRSPEVQRLPAASPAQRKAILKSATDDQIKTLCEICDNLLSGNIPTKKIKKLCSYKRVIRLLANRSVPISRKQTLKDANYTFNDKNEFELDGKPEYRSNVVDLFSYMMKNDQRVLTPPTGFAKFYAALRHVNIPLEWIDPQFSFTAGDIVRLSKARKGCLPGWTEETFRIYQRYPTIPPTYTLQDFNSKEIEDRFYNEELQKIDKSTNDYWAIEKIIRTKGNGASCQLFVKWVRFPDSQNSWIRADQITSHNESEHE